MSEDDLEQLTTMLEALARIGFYLQAYDEAPFLDDQMCCDAVALNLLVTGECARRLSEAVKLDLPAPWPQIIALRHRIAHGYSSLVPKRLWDTAHDHAPVLHRQVEAALEAR